MENYFRVEEIFNFILVNYYYGTFNFYKKKKISI